MSGKRRNTSPKTVKIHNEEPLNLELEKAYESELTYSDIGSESLDEQRSISPPPVERPLTYQEIHRDMAKKLTINTIEELDERDEHSSAPQYMPSPPVDEDSRKSTPVATIFNIPKAFVSRDSSPSERMNLSPSTS